MRRITTLLVVCFLATFVGCARQVPFNPSSGAMITETQDLTAIRDAIARALAAENYVVESESPGLVHARFEHRGNQLRIAVRYTASEYRIEYVDSVGLGYGTDPETGRVMISSHYPRYVTLVDRSIRSELGRPAREAQEAIEAQREHEMELARAETERQLAVERERHAAATEQERLRAQAAQAQADRARANADAEMARRFPPIMVNSQPVVVSRFEFEPRRYARSTISFPPGFGPDPYVLDGNAAGRIASADLGIPASCAGYWSARPAHVIELPAPYDYLRVDALSGEDVTLAIVTPDGQVWCDDDSAGGTNARLEGRFPAGTYAIYIGTYRPGRRADYDLHVSASAVRAPMARPVRPTRAAVPDCRQALVAAGHHPSHAVHCQGAEPHCAAALLAAGHHPAHLVHCQGVRASCATATLQAGRHPAHLASCQ